MGKVKAVFVGDAGVGKTCIVNRIANDTYEEGAEATVGAANVTVNIDVDERKVEFNIWDTAGQERYRSLTPMYFSGASLAFMVFDVTSEKSFQALDTFYELLQQKSPEYVKYVIVGNKADLASERKVTTKQAEDYSLSIGGDFYIEVSAKTGMGVSELFQRAALIPDLHFEKDYDDVVVSDSSAQGRSGGKKDCC
ncbi:Ras-related protein RABF2b [Tritrichomonas foetus]|uniref:Ras-related protein RABF2b n=1 Tax=Tritrichomonas foetus TaxID=1144522 RepID=A0A1J4J5E6_9EUKA|nr:Ras-related protein RABF2b [Tritrichomonas foetus]|eukprot:OHS92859.1 Ras-related protein RABF2b [Tritrichomonas foetus]